MTKIGHSPSTAVPDHLYNLTGSRLIQTFEIHHVNDGRVAWLCYVVVRTLAGDMAAKFFVAACDDGSMGCDSHRDLRRCGPVWRSGECIDEWCRSIVGRSFGSVYRKRGVEMAVCYYDFCIHWNWYDTVDGHRGCVSTLWTISRWNNGIGK